MVRPSSGVVRHPGTVPDEQSPRVVVARATDEHGEIALARRGDVVELIVDGVFAMDTVSSATEEALATLELARATGDRLRVLVGGLGLGYTLRALLDEPRVAQVEVVELHPALVGWARDGLVPTLVGVLDDPRVAVAVADVLDAVPAVAAGTLDAADRGILDLAGIDLLGYSGSKLSGDAAAFARAELSYSANSGDPVDTSYARPLESGIAVLAKDCPLGLAPTQRPAAATGTRTGTITSQSNNDD